MLSIHVLCSPPVSSSLPGPNSPLGEINFSRFPSLFSSLHQIKETPMSKPSTKKGINRSLTLCVPSSVVSKDYCKNPQQVAATAHQIGRAATLYGVAEIVIYRASKSEQDTSSAALLAGFLRYFITPSYLRKSVFKGELSTYDPVAKKLPKLPRLPFLSHGESGQYLQGLSVPRKVDKKKGKSKRKRAAMRAEEELTSYVNIGGEELLQLSNGVKIPVHSRVLVDKQKKAVVSVADVYKSDTTAPGNEDPIWTPDSFGYSVREISAFGKVFTECPYTDGYKYTAWVPCRAAAVTADKDEATTKALASIALISDETFLKAGVPQSDPAATREDIPVLLVFGDWPSLSRAILADQESFAGLTEADPLFDGRLREGRATQPEDAVLEALAKIDGL